MLGAGTSKIVLVAGKPSHGPEQHEFNAGTMLLEKCLRQNSGVEPVMVKGGWPENESVFDGASALVFYMDGGEGHPMIEDGRLAKIALSGREPKFAALFSGIAGVLGLLASALAPDGVNKMTIGEMRGAQSAAANH